MATVSAGQSVQLQIGAFDGLWVNCSGVGFIDFECKSRGTIQLTSQYQRIGYYGESVCVELRCVSGVIDYSTTPVAIEHLTAKQAGDANDSSPLDIKLAVNELVSAQRASLNPSAAILFGDSISAMNSFATPTGLSMSISGGVATITMPNHQMAVGWSFRINKTNYSLINDTNFGVYQVASVISANQFTFTAPAGAVDGSYSVAEICNINKTPFSGYWNVFNSVNGGQFSLLQIIARSGDSTTQMLERVNELAQYSGSTVFILGGTNDALTNTSIAASKSNILEIINKCLSFGCRPVVLSIPPINAAVTLAVGQTALQRAQWISEYNDYLKSIALSGKAVFVDIYSALVNKTSATADFAAGMSYDGVHLTPLAGVTLAPIINLALGQKNLPRVSSNLQTANQLLPNPLFIGTGGTANTGITGTIASGKSCQRTGTATAVGSLVARSDGNGNAQQLVVTAAADERIIYDEPSILSSVTAGDVVQFSTTISAAVWANVKTISVQFIFTVGSINFITNTAFNNQPSTTTAPYTGVTGELRFSTPPVKVPASVTAILTRIDTTFNAGTTVSYSESQVTKVV